MRVLPYGDRGLLLELPGIDAVVECVDALRADPAAQALLLDVVPGARTVLLVARPGVATERLRAVVDAGRSPWSGTRADATAAGATGAAGEVSIPVVYDGPDLAAVARHTGLSEPEVVAAHTGTPWRVAFGGFAPGFAYLAGGDPRLRVPRRDEPRARVPAGAVGLAGEFSGVYPRASPGGWQLIGRTGVALWDLEREPPALLAAGMVVRFVEATP